MLLHFSQNQSQMLSGGCVGVYETNEYGGGEIGNKEDEFCSSSSSSIGRNSDESSSLDSGGRGGGGGGGGEEVESEYKGGVFDGLVALEEVLPIKRGISNFYAGKSKSYTSLSEATSCSSIKDIVKPENALTRKRKNLLAHNIFWDKNNHNSVRTSSGGMSKRTINSRSSVALTAMGRSESYSNSESSTSNSSSPVPSLPPLPPQSRALSNKEFSASPQHQRFSPWRSFSLSDLHGVEAATSSVVSGFDNSDEKVTNNDEKSGKMD